MTREDVGLCAERIAANLAAKLQAAAAPEKTRLFLKRKLLKYRLKKPDWVGWTDRSVSWINGQYALGLAETGTPEAIRTLTRYYDKLLLAKRLGFPVFELPDQTIHAEVLLILYSRYGKKKYRPLILEAAGLLKTIAERNDGLVIYWPPDKELLVDTLGMIPGFCYLFADRFNAPEFAALADRQIEYTEEVCIDPDSGFPFHAYRYAEGTHAGASTWGRGVGWYLLGLSACALRHPERAGRLPEVFRNTFRFQDPQGFLPDDLAKPTHIDTSPTVMAALCLARCLESELFDEEDAISLAPYLAKSVRALAASVSPDGEVLNCSGECPSPGSYSTQFGNYFAQGYTLALFTLILRSERLQRLPDTCEEVNA